jgi:hypothetical protein
MKVVEHRLKEDPGRLGRYVDPALKRHREHPEDGQKQPQQVEVHNPPASTLRGSINTCLKLSKPTNGRPRYGMVKLML